MYFTAVAEHIVKFAMSMQVKTFNNVIFFRIVLKSAFDIVNLGMKYLRGILPSSVKIHS